MLQRILVLTSLLVLELIPLSVYVHTGLTVQRGFGGQEIAGWLVAFEALFICFGYKRAQELYKALIPTEGLRPLISWRYLAGHAAVFVLVLGLSTLTSPNGTSAFVLGAFIGSSLLA
ncbi:MAG: hypothetical protein WBW33_11175, partial [Bryobacteraceae bacterium]